MPRRDKAARILLAVAFLAVLGECCRCRQPPAPADDAALLARLAPLGYEHARVEGRRGAWPGLYLRRPGDDRPFADLARMSRAGGRRDCWRGVVVAWRQPPVPGFGDPEGWDFLRCGPWCFFGDPAELDRVAEALGLAR
jgi:hypothetical protein